MVSIDMPNRALLNRGAVVVGLTALIFVFDLSMPLGVAGGGLYVVVVLLGMWLPSKQHILVLAGVGTALIVVDYFLSTPASVPWDVITNRGLAFFAIWVTAILLYEIKKAGEKIHRLNTELEQRVEERTDELRQVNRVLKNEITSHRRAEEALRKSKARLKAIFDNFPASISFKDLEGRHLLVNEEFLRRHASEEEKVLGKTLQQIFPGDYADQHEELELGIGDEKTTRNREIRVVYPGGGERDVLVSIFPVIGAVGELMGTGTACWDITERKRAEESLIKFKLAVEQSPSMVVISDREGTIEYVNRNSTNITGYTAEEAIGQNARLWRSGKTPNKEYETMWDTILAGDTWRGEFLNKRKNGDFFMVSSTISPIKASDGTITHFVGVEEDITERKEAEKQLIQTQKMDSLGSLAGGIAHDINNMLLPILELTSMVARSLPEEDRRRKRLVMVIRAAERVKDMVARLLAFSHKDEAEASEVDMAEAVRKAMSILRSTLPATIEVREDLPANNVCVMANPKQIEAIMLNLATNAVDALEGKIGQLTVALAPVEADRALAAKVPNLKTGRYARLTVSDTGCGMDEKVMEKIFDPFFTTKGEGRGTGLGLSMVFGTVSKYGGAIDLTSAVGKGTTFEIYLPLAGDAPK